jgi:hypothetical protein
MLVCHGSVKLSVKTFTRSSHRGLIVGHATEATARALCVPALCIVHALAVKAQRPLGWVPWPWAVGQAAPGLAEPSITRTASFCSR